MTMLTLKYFTCLSDLQAQKRAQTVAMSSDVPSCVTALIATV